MGKPAPLDLFFVSIQAQFMRFVLVGGLATALHYAIMILLVQTNRLNVVAASSTGFAIGALVNYALNRTFTFASNRSHVQALPRFMVAAASGLAINAALLWLFHVPGSLHYLIAQVLATVGALLWNFTLNRLWIFPSSGPKAKHV